MNANRNKTGRTMKKAVMATVIAGTLATSVAYPGLMGVPGAQVAMAEEKITEDGFTYQEVDGGVEITAFSGTDAKLPAVIEGKAVKSVTIHGDSTIESFDATACKTGLTKVDLTQASGLKSVNCSGCGDLVDVVVEENPELTDLNVLGTKAEKVCVYGSSNLVQENIKKPEKTKIQKYSVDRKDDDREYIYYLYSDGTAKITGLCNSAEKEITIPKTITGNGQPYKVTGIELNNAGLTKLDLSDCCENLTYLSCVKNDITELDVSSCGALEYLDCSHNQIKYLDVSNCGKLYDLYCNENNISELNVSSCGALEWLCCYKSGLSKLDVSGCRALINLNCAENSISELDVSSCEALSALRCEKNNMLKLNISGCRALEELYCVENKISELDVSKCTKLMALQCRENDLKKLTVSGISTLGFLECCYNENLTFLNVQNNANITYIDVSNTKLKKIYIYGSPNLSKENGIIGKTDDMEVITEEYKEASDPTPGTDPDPGTEPDPGTDPDPGTEPTPTPTPTPKPSQGGSGSGTTTGGGGSSSSGSGSSSSSGGGSSVAPVATPTPAPTPEQKPATEQTPAPGQTPSSNPTPATEPAQGSEEKADKKEKNEPVIQKEKGVTTEAKISGKTTTVTLASNKKKVEVPKTVTDENGKKHKVTKLGAKAFAECSKAEQIVLPASIVSVDKKAFSGIKTEEKTIILDASLTKKEVRKMEKKLRKAGFKGIIKQAEKNPGKKTGEK